MQSCDPRPETEDEVTNGKKLHGDKFVHRIPSPMRGFRADDEEKTEVTFVARTTSETAFTPMFFYFMDRILERFGMSKTISSIIDTLDDVTDLVNLSITSKEGSRKYSENLFSHKFIAFLDWVMVCSGSVYAPQKNGYCGNDGGTKFDELCGKFKVKERNEEGGVFNPWVEAFTEEYIKHLKGKAQKSEKATFSASGCFDSDDEVKGGPM